MWANKPGPASARGNGRVGAAGCTIFSQDRHDFFSRDLPQNRRDFFDIDGHDLMNG
jgi:hypothetical protein